MGRLLASMVATLGLLVGLFSTTPPLASAAGGSLTALELTGSTGTWSVLDPLPDTTAGEHWDFYNSIYGMLFQPGANGKILPDIAQSWKTTDNGLQFDIMLRHGVNFSDGTPLNADAVVFNLQRDFNPKNACGCLNNFTSVSSVSKINNYEVAINLKSPDINLIDGFPEEAPDWMISPTAFQKEGETNFGQQPVGAGPFVVVQNSPSTKLALKANPNYWDKGEPKLSSLTFVTVNSDLNAIQAMQAGSGEVYPGLSTPSVVETVKSANQFAVYKAPSIQTFTININNQHPPFNNILAREALYYALDPVTMNKAIEGGLDTISESPTGPGGLFWTPKVPNYRSYNLAKAKSIVKQLGGLSFTLWTITPSPLVPVIEAEESQFAAAGINAKIELVNLPTMVHASATGAVQAVSTSVGNYNPSILPGVPFAYLSTSPFSNVKDPNLDKLIYAAIGAPTLKAEGQDYRKVFSYLNQEAYAPYLFTVTRFLTAKKNVKGLDPSAPEIPWQSVSG